jgi:MraZ protein
MALFLSSVTNKVDKKGRVSVPAPFRAALKSLGYNSFFSYPSFTNRSLECCTADRIERISQSLAQMNPFAAEYEAFATVLADCCEIGIDADGRIVLPESLVEHAEIQEGATFVGQGERFYIWEPDAYKTFRLDARERAAAQRENFRWSPADAARGTS